MAEAGSGGRKEILFEFIRIGGQMRVTAIDPDSGVEVVIVAPLTAPRHHVQQVALAKLQRKLARSEPPSGQ